MIVEQSDSIVFHSEQDQVWRNKKGNFHRKGGPAVVRSDGTQKWYLDGKPVTQEEAER